MSLEAPNVDIAAAATEAVAWLRRRLEHAKLAGTLAPRIANPRTQGWIYGFARAVGEELGLSADKRYELEARLFVSLFEGTPMGEQLGLEALMMAQRMNTLPGARATLSDWNASMDLGARAAKPFAALLRETEAFARTLE